MKLFVLLLVMSMLLLSCSAVGRVPETNAVCEGLRNPVDVLVNQVLKYSEDTPSTVIIAATTLAVAYDGGCDGQRL
jgi:hypothetical protein